jgi:ABC-2 type transport system permease protein
MAAEAGFVRRTRVASHPPLRALLVGLGSVFGKTLRDSRAAILVVTGLLGVMIVAGGNVMATTYGSQETRQELARLSHDIPPMLRGFYGDPVNTDTLGGFISWHYSAYFALITGLWSILALSSTLALEARRGSLEFALVTQRSRRLVAFEKLAGHLAGLATAVALLGFLAWVTGAAFATDPRDAIPPSAAAAFAVGLGLRALVAGSIAFAFACLIGRGAAAGIAGALMLGGYVVYGYRTVVPLFDSIAGLTWWSWMAPHVPLAGEVAWPNVAFTALISAILLVVGFEVFVRRDVGVTVALPTPEPPRALIGVRGPVGRSFGDLLPGTIWWSVGLGVYGELMAAASRTMHEMLTGSPGLMEVFRRIIPDIDITTAPGFLQLAFADLGFVLFGLAATTFVANRWSDETERRLELQLTTPLTRARWAAANGIAVWIAVALATLALAAAILGGVAAGGQDPGAAATGTIALGLYGAALAGLGIAVGGLFGPRTAAPVVAAVAIGTFLLDTLAPILRLPDWVAQLALTTHMGQPFIGAWDAGGVLACLALAIGGLVDGAWGMSRRDVSG